MRAGAAGGAAGPRNLGPAWRLHHAATPTTSASMADNAPAMRWWTRIVGLRNNADGGDRGGGLRLERHHPRT